MFRKIILGFLMVSPVLAFDSTCTMSNGEELEFSYTLGAEKSEYVWLSYPGSSRTLAQMIISIGGKAYAISGNEAKIMFDRKTGMGQASLRNKENGQQEQFLIDCGVPEN